MVLVNDLSAIFYEMFCSVAERIKVCSNGHRSCGVIVICKIVIKFFYKTSAVDVKASIYLIETTISWKQSSQML
eukprot:UN15846